MSGIKIDICFAFDINTVANEVYKHNFPDTKLLNRNLISLTTEDIDKMQADVFTMSPPCQPFTRYSLNYMYWRDTLFKITFLKPLLSTTDFL